MKKSLLAAASLLFASSVLFADQGAGRMLYTVPNATFIEKPSGDSVVTVNDTSGSIATLQSSINNARSSNPNSIIVIHLLRGATYSVSSAGLVLGSRECLVGSGAIIKAASAGVTVPLIQISTDATNVSVAGGTLDGNGATINGIVASSVDRVNIDKVVVRNCGLDCILLTGNGNSTFDNELTVTRCDVSGSPGHAGISIQSATQATCLDNDCHDNSVGIFLSCAWANIANNTCENNGTGIDANGGNDNVVANNTCNNNGTGIHAGGTKNMIVSNAIGGSSTAGISSTGTSNNFIDNLLTSGNAVTFSSGGTTDNVVAYKSAASASGQNYFYPPLIDNQHSDPVIVNGMGRTDLTIGSTTIASVQSQYDSARAANPNDVIVLHLTGSYTVGGAPLTLSANTCVLLGGTIQINASTTASAAVAVASGAARVSISGGIIDGGNITGNNGITASSASMVQVDNLTIRNFGLENPRSGGSDLIHFSGGSTPYIVTRCTLNGGSARGIWLQLSGQKSLISDNDVSHVNQDGVDCDSSTFASVVKFNNCHDLVRYGVFFEQSASHNLALGNVCNNDGRDINLYNNSDTPRGATAFNSVVCNSVMGANGLRNGSTGTNTVVTSHNFFFNNVVVSASISSEHEGTQNYFSQTYRSGGSLSTSGSEVFFNSPDVDGPVQIRDSHSGLAVVVQDAATNNGVAIVTDVASSLGNGSDNDEWSFIPTDSGFYRVMNKNSGLAMVVQGAATTNGAPVVQFAYSNDATDNDEWLIQPAGAGLYNFVNRLSGLNLDVKGAGTNAGTTLQQWPANGNANQAFQLVEDAPAVLVPDFSISGSPASRSVTPGGGTSFTATIAATNGFAGTVTFSVSGLPAGATGSFVPASVSGSGTSTLNVTTAGGTAAGNYTLTITGTSGSLVHSDTVVLAVTDFSISATPGSQTVPVTGSTTYTVDIGNLNGFSGTVNLGISGLPSGATATFNPTSVNSIGSSTLTVTTSSSTPAGNYTLTVTGTSGSLSHATTVSLAVTDFSISTTPASVKVTAGAGTNCTTTVTASNGFNGSVSFSITGLPAGTTATFTPSSVTGSGSATLNIATSGTTPAGTNVLTVKGTSGGLLHSTSVTLIVNTAGGALPAGWTDQDIGAVGLAGSATFNNGTFSVTGSGADIWTAADQFNFAYQSVTNDLTITARVVSESGTGSFAKAAVMIRESTATNAVEVSVLLTPTNGVAMEVRPATGAATVNVTGWQTGTTPPAWIRLVRSGSTFTSFKSADGVTWTRMASTNVTMALFAKAGLAVTSHDNTQRNTAAFDNVNISRVAFTDRDIGAVGLAGSAAYTNGVYTVKGSGSDIWSTNDLFNFDSQSDTGDATVTARVVTQQNTSAWVKSGVMIRETIAANSAYVGLYVTVSNGVSMQFRGATGVAAIDLARQAGPVAPYWVKLVRAGNTFTGFSSADGVTWTQVGSTNVTMSATETVGLAVCAHNNAALNTSTFDNGGVQ
jgi:hypothetical protein